MANVCKNCETVFEGKFCNNCGQKHYSEHDKNFGHIVEEALHFVTHLEGTLPRTVKTILLKPGKLSQDYCFGIRKKYYKPISFFLLLVVLYLLFPIFTGLNQPLAAYNGMPVVGPTFQSQIEAKMSLLHLSFEDFSMEFHHKSEKLSKIFLFLLIPLTALPLKLLFFRSKRPLFDHFIMATELCSFILLVLFLLLPIVILPAIRLINVNRIQDDFLLPVAAILIFTFSFIAIKRFYDQKWYWILPKAILLTGSVAVLSQFVYKPLLFEITMLFL
ncbi:DUF3667 domain-containing protein [Flavobacterium sp.]|uniref:DUF3667 domain-containing protein n=1 Tax=Flavobacterium sp. TaxID=239 RepID=UPI0025C3FEE1|nr:DUF3667 domain-containing protein [Flavobacterium sp.]